MKHITKESHGPLYGGGSQVSKVGTEGQYAIADKRDAEFVSSYDVSGNKFVRFAILSCNEDKIWKVVRNVQSEQKSKNGFNLSNSVL